LPNGLRSDYYGPLNPFSKTAALPKQEGILNSTITVAELRAHPSALSLLVDVRSGSEFAAGHIPEAVNIPMDQIEARLDDLPTSLPIVLICQTGTRARMTAGLLASCQREITVLEGGTKAWIDSGQPVVVNVKTRWSLERQVRLGAGLLVLTAAILALAANPLWVLLCGFVGLGLTFAGLTDLCPMAVILERMPWNRQSHCVTGVPHVEQTGTYS
ncbi:MAG: rhodanese-like domain-containing protein, partial [Candidatus Sulfotelmatobacter sp.]